MSIVDPPEPPEGGGTTMRAKDLINRSCIFRPTGEGYWPAKPATEHERAQKAQPFVECDVWVLDRAGVIEEGTGVRVSWWKAVEQLKAAPPGSFMPGKPRTEEGSNAIYLAPLTPEARTVALAVIESLEPVPAVPSGNGADPYAEFSEEPF